jgi:hydroxyacyl-ACP dehydratase HTD2-like protein with hotdog domain
MAPNYVTEAVQALIGTQSPPVEAPHAVEASEVRRFHHATMDAAPRYWDAASCGAVRAGGVVAPPAFPVHAFRRAADEADPLSVEATSDFGGYSRTLRPGLPALDVPRERLLNGGYEYEFFRYVRLGERVVCRSRYKDIYQRTGTSGPMVFVVIEDEYATTGGELLLRSLNTMILR